MGLLNDNLLFVDRETQSIWSQLHGKAIHGAMKEQPLKMIPSLQTTWKHWRELHPRTRVLVVKGKDGYPYLYRNRKPGSPRPAKAPKAHDTSALGLGLVVGQHAVFFPFKALQRVETPLEYPLGSQTVTVHYRKDALTAWAEDESGNLLTGVLAYDFGWLEFFPQSAVFEAP